MTGLSSSAGLPATSGCKYLSRLRNRGVISDVIYTGTSAYGLIMPIREEGFR
jgi:hypothetical protein